MVIYKAKDYQDMSRKAANIISAQIIMKPNCVLGAYSVVVGSIITRPQLITKSFVEEMKKLEA